MASEVSTEGCQLLMLVSNSIITYQRQLLVNYLAGSVETGAYFVFYERLKSYFANRRPCNSPTFFDYLLASSSAKLAAVCLCYPHEVARTRLRQDLAGKRQ